MRLGRVVETTVLAVLALHGNREIYALSMHDYDATGCTQRILASDRELVRLDICRYLSSTGTGVIAFIAQAG